MNLHGMGRVYSSHTQILEKLLLHYISSDNHESKKETLANRSQ